MYIISIEHMVYIHAKSLMVTIHAIYGLRYGMLLFYYINIKVLIRIEYLKYLM